MNFVLLRAMIETMNEDKLTKAQKKELRKQERATWEEKIEIDQKKTKFKKIGLWVGGAVALVLAVWGLVALVNSPSSSTSTNLIAPKLTNTDITSGPQGAKTTLIEYADFQCPACGFYHPWTKQLMQDFNGKVLFVYRFFPLTNLHQNAIASSQAAYAAYLQDKFWQMHDTLFEHQQDWATATDPTKIFTGYAKTIGLDTDKFLTDMQADGTKKFINAQEDAGTSAGVNATPTFFVNGKSIQNPTSYGSFKKIISDSLAK